MDWLTGLIESTNFKVWDWVIFVGLFVLLTSVSFFFKRFVKSVAGFLVAGRNVGRYLGLESDSVGNPALDEWHDSMKAEGPLHILHVAEMFLHF